MHGEYKVPGGKLIVIDLELLDGYLRNVELSGDFFLEPEETLDRITATLEGVPATITTEAIIHRVNAATAGAELLGITADGVAHAVQRALGKEAQ